MNLSFQLYSAREFPPWETVLSLLSRLGYTQVEGYDGVYQNPEQFRAQLDEHGLSMPSGHFALALLEAGLDEQLAVARTLGVSQLYAPWLAAETRPDDAAGWVLIATRLASLEKQIRAAGLRFGWHNHEFEFMPLADGTVPMQVLLDQAPELGWEADIAWMVRAGIEPLAWVEQYGPRITAAHVKDIARAGQCQDEDGWADVGQGVLDWSSLTDALRANGTELFVIEHDKPSDVARCATRSFDAFRSCLSS